MNIFLDCGFYVGGALKKYVDKGIVDNTWMIYAFEPNPELGVDQRVKDHELDIKLIKKAVWTRDGRTMFHIGGRNDAASIAGTSGHAEYREKRVSTIDFPRFVAELPEAYVICSMDIEGAEFVVLEKMLEDGSIDKIKILDIEFHHRLMSDYTDTDARRLIRKIRARGISVKLKVKLT